MSIDQLETIEAPTQLPINADEGEHEKLAHVVVPASAVTEAYITGAPVTALCGKTWVPTRDPKRYDLCPECADILKAVGRNPDGTPYG